MKYHIAICDDEQEQVEYLSSLVKNWAIHSEKPVAIHSFSSVGEFLFHYEDRVPSHSDASPSCGVSCAGTQKSPPPPGQGYGYHILLLDIDLKDGSGMELARKIRAAGDDVQIIFITGYPDFMADGYEVAALHYLMKPVSADKLEEVLGRAATNIRRKERAILIRSGKDIRRIGVDRIVYIEVLSHTVTIYTTDGQYEARLSIGEVKDMLGEGFVRCHRSYLAALSYIARITRGGVEFDDGRVIPLSRNAYQSVNQAFISYYKGERK